LSTLIQPNHSGLDLRDKRTDHEKHECEFKTENVQTRLVLIK